ncbi:hypothetical protein BLI708_06615 [Bifidobacterium imperatoris]|uniref:Uncharacterized protein n=1 Tax=Bifidobacterium imperatoris TaxID=2020965 RepID=A0A2N5IQX2_9BIFI|nr:hypothetical protein [Bifidobacterium imperatoris]PLS24355.1 hypothetical protein Tam1G_1618 [Bifidobacterium imperatoris]QSY56945.1 hypothetical protein BLI708_06615 [Bifidobacterium imperatoris]
MSRFDPESSVNVFDPVLTHVEDSGDPYRFMLNISCEEGSLVIRDLSMSDMVRINRRFAEEIRKARHVRAKLVNHL